MNKTNSFLINNGTQDPNQFISKIGRSFVINPNSEIAVNKLALQDVKLKNINSSNDHFVILWGQYNMDNNNTIDPNNTQLQFLPPEDIYLKHGQYNVFGESVYDYDNHNNIYDNNNILHNFINSINTQSKYFQWGWLGKYEINGSIDIKAYLRNDQMNHIKWNSAILSSEMTNTIYEKTDVEPSFNILIDKKNAFALVGSERAPFPYDAFAKTETPDNPQGINQYTLEQYDNTTDRIVRGFGGFIIEDQEFYKNNESYNIEKDWLGINNDENNFYEKMVNIVNRMPISWEIGQENEIYIIRREIIGNSVGEIVQSIDTNIFYDGDKDIIITFKPNITDKVAGNRINSTISGITVIIKDGDTGADSVVGIINLDSSYYGFNWRHALCWSTSDNAILPNFGKINIFTSGIQESDFNNDNTDNLGPICGDIVNDGNHLGNVSATLIMSSLKSGTVLDQISPPTTVNYQFEQILKSVNCNLFEPLLDDGYNINKNNGYIDYANIEVNLSIMPLNFCICVDNLPIQNYTCSDVSGKTQKRILVVMNSTNGTISDPMSIISTNLNWTRLDNNGSIIINNFQIRLTNLDGSPFNNLKGSFYIELLIRENKKPEIIYNMASKNNKNEVLDNTEKNFEISKNRI